MAEWTFVIIPQHSLRSSLVENPFPPNAFSTCLFKTTFRSTPLGRSWIGVRAPHLGQVTLFGKSHGYPKGPHIQPAHPPNESKNSLQESIAAKALFAPLYTRIPCASGFLMGPFITPHRPTVLPLFANASTSLDHNVTELQPDILRPPRPPRTRSAENQYEKWKTTIPALVIPFVAYLEDTLGKPAPHPAPSISRCKATCERKKTELVALYYDCKCPTTTVYTP